MSPEEYLRRNLGSGGNSLPWLLPLLYVLLALTLVSWAGMRYSNRSRRGRALFVFTIGIVLIVLASAFFFLRAVGTTQAGRGGRPRPPCSAARCWWSPRARCCPAWRTGSVRAVSCEPSSRCLNELGRRHPDVGIGVRPRGPLVFRVAERMSLISDALFLEATAADAARRTVDTTGALPSRATSTTERVRVAYGAAAGTGACDRTVDLRRPRGRAERRGTRIPGLGWLRQPNAYSDREWILEIAQQYRTLVRSGGANA